MSFIFEHQTRSLFKRDSRCDSSQAQINKNYIEPQVFVEHQRKVGGKDAEQLMSRNRIN